MAVLTRRAGVDGLLERNASQRWGLEAEGRGWSWRRRTTLRTVMVVRGIRNGGGKCCAFVRGVGQQHSLSRAAGRLRQQRGTGGGKRGKGGAANWRVGVWSASVQECGCYLCTKKSWWWKGARAKCGETGYVGRQSPWMVPTRILADTCSDRGCARGLSAGAQERGYGRITAIWDSVRACVRACNRGGSGSWKGRNYEIAGEMLARGAVVITLDKVLRQPVSA